MFFFEFLDLPNYLENHNFDCVDQLKWRNSVRESLFVKSHCFSSELNPHLLLVTPPFVAVQPSDCSPIFSTTFVSS